MKKEMSRNMKDFDSVHWLNFEFDNILDSSLKFAVLLGNQMSPWFLWLYDNIFTCPGPILLPNYLQRW